MIKCVNCERYASDDIDKIKVCPHYISTTNRIKLPSGHIFKETNCKMFIVRDY